MTWGWLRALVEGFVMPLLAAWQQHRHGRTSQQRDDAQAALETERKIAETLARDDDVRAARQRAVVDLLRRELKRQAPADPRPPGE